MNWSRESYLTKDDVSSISFLGGVHDSISSHYFALKGSESELQLIDNLIRNKFTWAEIDDGLRKVYSKTFAPHPYDALLRFDEFTKHLVVPTSARIAYGR